MIYTPGFWLPTWKREIQSMEIPGANWNTPTDYWFQFYFLATDKSGAQTRSPIYRTLVTFSTYAVPR
jgi:hypothetical protein